MTNECGKNKFHRWVLCGDDKGNYYRKCTNCELIEKI